MVFGDVRTTFLCRVVIGIGGLIEFAMLDLAEFKSGDDGLDGFVDPGCNGFVAFIE